MTMQDVESAAKKKRQSEFGEVRSLLQKTPSSKLFEELCTLFPHADIEDEEILPYIVSHLRLWPSSIHRNIQDNMYYISLGYDGLT